MSTPNSITEQFEDIGRNEITGESGAITPRARHGVPDFARVETWIDRGERGGFLTGKGATSDVAHITIERDDSTDDALHEWIREYSAGRREFQDVHYDRARQFSKDGQPAMGIIAARQVLEIPWAGGAFGGIFTGGYPPIEIDKALGLSKRQQGRGVDMAFSVPTKMKGELRKLIMSSREAIGVGRPALERWGEAGGAFEEEGDSHAAGLAALENAAAQLNEGSSREVMALLSDKALGQIDQRLGTVLETAQTIDTAEIDELAYHLRHAVAATVRFDRDAYSTLVDSESLISATYKIDDLGERREVVKDAYRHLARYSWRLRDGLFFSAEARGVEREIAQDEFFEKNVTGWSPAIPPNRKDRRHKRP